MHHQFDHALCQRSEGFYTQALSNLKAPLGHYSETPLPHFLLPQKTDDLAAMQEVAARLGEGAQTIVILGTGGSSLGAQVLAQITGALTIAGGQTGPHLIFADNLDADSYQLVLGQELASMRFLAVSKSGNTAETLMQFGGAVAALQKAGLDPARHIAALTGTSDNALRRLATHYRMALLAHEDDIGGRFSVLSNVGLLPAIWAGCDVQAIRDGAGAEIEALLSQAPEDNLAARGAATQWAHMQAGRMISVIMPYADRLDRLAFWYRQLWAESLGKQGHGSLPANALGPVDQHSQMQLYLGGPDDKFYTLLTHPTRGRGTSLPDEVAEQPELQDLAGRSMGDLVEAEARGSFDTLVSAGRPVRLIELSEINEFEIGAVLMHFMAETILTADLLAIDAFDQPEVEAGKIRAKHYMQQMSVSTKG